MDHSEDPRDWEMNEEVPPERMRRKWEEEEIEGFHPALCYHCERAVRTDSLLCPFCGESLVQGKQKPSWMAAFIKRMTAFFRKKS